MSDQTILVIGATGMLGAPVARRLRQEGNRVRLLVRDVNRARAMFGADFEYISGDVRDEATVRQALTGVQGVYISLQGRTESEFETVEYQGTALVARLAAQAGVKRIGYLSGALVSSETTHVPQEKAKYLAEESIVASGVPYTIFRPTM
ncbi:MAG: NAD(P)H-binding protein, partial [Anaerolineae bacterium]|nr:NAD(P)H-binding protein [Anaerolineae bacterium]